MADTEQEFKAPTTVPLQRFAGQVAVITGGARGIGFAIAQRLASEGAHVVLLDLSAAALEPSTQKLLDQGFKASFKEVNVTQAAAVQTTFDAIDAEFKRIDILVQSAGVTGKTGIKTHEVDPDDFDFVYSVNLKGLFLCCRAALGPMLRNNYGRIVNIASIAGKEGNAGMLAYSSTKAGVIGLTKVIGKEYAETGITCNALAPAVVRTEMVAAMPATQVKYMTDKIPMKRCGTLDEIASTVSFIASPECSFQTGFCFDATGGRATY